MSPHKLVKINENAVECRRSKFNSISEPEISAKTGGESKSIDAKSIAIGFAVGVILTIGVVIAFWFVVTRIYKRKQNGRYRKKCLLMILISFSWKKNYNQVKIASCECFQWMMKKILMNKIRIILDIVKVISTFEQWVLNDMKNSEIVKTMKRQ